MPDSPLLAILVYDLSATGVVRNAIRIAGAASRAGIRTELWVVRGDGHFRSEVPGAVPVVEIGGFAGAGRGPALALAVPALSRLIRDRRPRVLLSAGNHFHLAASAAYALAGAPVETRFLGRASNAPPAARDRNALAAAVADAIDTRKYSRMRRVVAVSEELAAILARRFAVDPQRIVTIPNGVDIARIEGLAAAPLDDPWFGEAEPPVIVSAGRIARQKDFALLVRAFALLHRQRPARLLILGDGSPGNVATLRTIAHDLGVADAVRLPGFEANPFRYFARAGLFALSSLWEGSSNAVLEALACGCPVVAVDCPTGIRELLDEGRIGPVVAARAPADLAAAMATRLAAPRDAAALKAHAARFHQDRMLDRYLALIAEQLQ